VILESRSSRRDQLLDEQMELETRLYWRITSGSSRGHADLRWRPSWQARLGADDDTYCWAWGINSDRGRPCQRKK